MTDIERAQQFVSSQRWIFAKTMADIPHCYCMKEQTADSNEFLWFVNYMEANSVDGTFRGREYKYFFFDGYKYWHMDSSAEECTLINREWVNTLEKIPVEAMNRILKVQIGKLESYISELEYEKSALKKQLDEKPSWETEEGKNFIKATKKEELYQIQKRIISSKNERIKQLKHSLDISMSTIFRLQNELEIAKTK